VCHRNIARIVSTFTNLVCGKSLTCITCHLSYIQWNTPFGTKLLYNYAMNVIVFVIKIIWSISNMIFCTD